MALTSHLHCLHCGSTDRWAIDNGLVDEGMVYCDVCAAVCAIATPLERTYRRGGQEPTRHAVIPAGWDWQAAVAEAEAYATRWLTAHRGQVVAALAGGPA